VCYRHRVSNRPESCSCSTATLHNCMT
jgi:hypothetical protein